MNTIIKKQLPKQTLYMIQLSDIEFELIILSK